MFACLINESSSSNEGQWRKSTYSQNGQNAKGCSDKKSATGPPVQGVE